MVRTICMESLEIIPQGLKPLSFCDLHGTAEAVPLQSIEVFRKPLKLCPCKASRFSASP